MTPTQIMQNPNFFIECPIAIKDVELPIEIFKLPDDEEGNPTEGYYTVQEFVEAGGHTIVRFNNDGSRFIKGFCFTMDTIDVLRTMMPTFNLTYGVDVKLHNALQVGDVLSGADWTTQDMV